MASTQGGAGRRRPESQTGGLLSSQFLPLAPKATHSSKSGQCRHPHPRLHARASEIKRIISPRLIVYV